MDLLCEFKAERGLGPDLAFRGGDLILGDGLLEAVILSLFIDARAPATEILPAGTDRRGWWGDGVGRGADEARPIGSIYWTRAREKQTEETRLWFLDETRRRLAWMVPSREPAVRDVRAADARVWWPRRGLLAIVPTLTLTTGRRVFEFERGLEDGRLRYLGAI